MDCIARLVMKMLIYNYTFMNKIQRIASQLEKSYAYRPIKLDTKKRAEEFAKTKTGISAQNFYNMVKIYNTYAEAKQHNLSE